MPRQIEQRRADRARGPDREDRRTRGQTAVSGEHLEGGQVGERDTDRLGRVDAIGDGHQEPRRPDGVLGVAADDAEVGHHLTLLQAGHTGTEFIDDSDDVVSGGERHRPLVVRIAATPNEDVREACAGSQDLDPHLVGTGLGDRRLFRQFHYFRAAEPRDRNILPGHPLTVDLKPCDEDFRH